MKTTKGVYVKYVKKIVDNYDNEKFLFVILKNNSFALEDNFFVNEGTTFLTFKKYLFGSYELKNNQVYFFNCHILDEYNGVKYCKKLAIGIPSQYKIDKLLENDRYQPLLIDDLESSDDDDSKHSDNFVNIIS